MGVEGFEPTKSNDDRFTVYYNSPSLPHSQNFVAPKGFEPLLTENQNLARYHYAKGLFSLLNQNVKEQFVIL